MSPARPATQTRRDHMLHALVGVVQWSAKNFASATRSAHTEWLRTVLRSCAAERARQADELLSAHWFEGDGPKQQLEWPSSVLPSDAWQDDAALVVWCEARERVVEKTYSISLDTAFLPDAIKDIARQHRVSVHKSLAWLSTVSAHFGRQRIDSSIMMQTELRAHESRLRKVERQLDPRPRVFLVGLCSALDVMFARELGQRGMVCESMPGAGEAVFRCLQSPPAMLLVDAWQSAKLCESLAATMRAEAADVPVIAVDGRTSVDSLPQLFDLSRPVENLATGSRLETPRPQRILLVEDDQDLRMALDFELKNLGFEVDLACDGLEALERLDPMRQDAVILDLMMPRLGGVGFLSRIEEKTLTPPPVVIYSAFAEPALRGHPSVRAVLTKTAGIDAIADALKRCIAVPEFHQEPVSPHA